MQLRHQTHTGPCPASQTRNFAESACHGSHRKTRLRSIVASVTLGLVGVGTGLYALTTPASASPATTATITSVTFSSGTSVSSPTALVTINGSGFGSLPDDSPAGDPQVTGDCPGSTSGYDGLSFGTHLYFNNLGATGFEAGNGPSLNCIGLVIWKYTPTQIEYGFGSYYQRYAPWTLQNGDSYSVHVKGAAYSGTITFTS